MEVAALIAIQFVATAVGFGLLWRKLDQVGEDVGRIKRMLETLELMRFSSAAQKRAAQPARVEPALAPLAADPPGPPSVHDDPFSSSWVRPGARVPREDDAASARPLPARQTAPRQVMSNEIGEDMPTPWRADITPETGRLIAGAAAALAPVLGFAFSAPAGALIACGLSVCAALMVTSLRPVWTGAAFVGAFGAGAWAVTAFALDAAQGAPVVFSVFAAIAGAVGLVHARLRGMAPGAMMTLLMGGALLALGNAVGLAGAAGVGLGALIALAAIIGASGARLEGLHLSAFAAAILALYVFSGQAPAAIWFTPVTAWLGALFFAIAAIRIPVVGARGALLAATGVTAPLLSAGALSLSQHGLANPLAAAGAFLALAVMCGALIIVAAQREQRGVSGLRQTAWILLAGACLAFLTATLLALPLALTATPVAGAALGLVGRDFYKPLRIWRAGALGLLLAAAALAWIAALQGWPNLLTLAGSFAAPAVLAGVAAHVSGRRASKGASAMFEALAIAGGAASLIALMRWLLTSGAPNTTQIGFVEAGIHVATWGGAALALAARAEQGAPLVRRTAAAGFGIASLCAMALAALLWLTPFWNGRAPSGVDMPLLQHAPLGFALPAIVAWAHWAYWRGRGVYARTRLALACAALLTAAFIALEVASVREGMVATGATDWVFIGAAVAAFAAAIGINFAPGVTDETTARLRLDKYFQRNRRGQQSI